MQNLVVCPSRGNTGTRGCKYLVVCPSRGDTSMLCAPVGATRVGGLQDLVVCPSWGNTGTRGCKYLGVYPSRGYTGERWSSLDDHPENETVRCLSEAGLIHR